MVASNVIVLSTCAICRDEDGGTDMVVTKCGHAFHSECMRDWEKTERTHGRAHKCPYCNVYFSGSPHGYYDDYSSSSLSHKPIRLHSLSFRKVILLEDGEPSPEEELNTVRTRLDITKNLLNKEYDKVRQLEIDLANLRRDKETLEATVTKVKTASVNLNTKLSNTILELKAEKQNRNKALSLHLGEKDRLQKRIDDSNAYIDKLKAERHEGNSNVFALRNDLTNLRNLYNKQALFIKQLQMQMVETTRDRNRTQLAIHSMNREQILRVNYHNRVPNDNASGVLLDLNKGFQRLEVEYLALKGLFSQKLQEREKSAMHVNPLTNELPINPALLPKIDNESVNLQISDGNNITPIYPDIIDPMVTKPSARSGTKKFGKNKGKQRMGCDNSTKQEPNTVKGNNKLSNKKEKSKDQPPIITKSISKKLGNDEGISNELNTEHVVKTEDLVVIPSHSEPESEISIKRLFPDIPVCHSQIETGSSKENTAEWDPCAYEARLLLFPDDQSGSNHLG